MGRGSDLEAFLLHKHDTKYDFKIKTFEAFSIYSTAVNNKVLYIVQIYFHKK